MHAFPDGLPRYRLPPACLPGDEGFSGEELHPHRSPKAFVGPQPLGGTFLLTTGWAEPWCNLLGRWGDPRPVVSGSLCPSPPPSAL